MVRKKEALLDIERIEEEIAKKNWGKEEFFDKADIGKSTWHRIKRAGTASIPVSCAIAYALGMNPDDIIYKMRKIRHRKGGTEISEKTASRHL